MRSTVDINDAIDRQLRKRADKLGLTYKEILNRTLAAGLSYLESKKREPFKVAAKACGFKPGVDPGHLNRLADELDDDERFKK